MLRSHFNKVAGLQDCCKTYLLHALLRFYFSLAKTLKSFIDSHRGIFITKLNIYDGAFFIQVKPYFKNVLNSIELPLDSIFYTTHPFVKKYTTLKNSGEVIHYFSYGQNIFLRIAVLY